MRPALEPLVLEPRYHAALWGGRRLATLPGAPADAPVAEAWLVSDLPDRATRVAEGPHAGRTLRELIAEYPESLLGRHAGRYESFPLLIKLIDAALPLSVQVHPDDEKARTMAGQPNGKTEAWVVLDAELGSRIYDGLRNGTGERELRAALESGRVVDVLDWFEPRRGEGVFLPAGTVHALGGGVTVFEVQQASDVTYRLYDWGRTDPATGRPRTLHVNEALACTDFSVGPRDQFSPADRWGMECSYFRLTVHRVAAEVGGDGVCRALATYGGPARGCVDVWPGQAVVLPASAGVCRVTPDPGAWLFECALPDD